MTSRLSSLLVRDGVLTPRRVERAFRRQVQEGGALDTVLLEMNALPEARLVEYLCLATGLPPATTASHAITEDAVSCCSEEVAAKYRAVPLRTVEGAVEFAVCDPVDLEALAQMANELGVGVRPVVVPEYRFHVLFGAAYSAPVDDRFSTLGDAGTPVEIHGAETIPVVVGTPEPEPEPEPPEDAAPEPVEDLPTEMHTAPPPPEHGATTTRTDKLPGVITKLRAADNRDDIFKLLLQGVRTRAHYAALLQIKSGVAKGHLVLCSNSYDSSLEGVEIDLSVDSPFKRAADGTPHLGPITGDNPGIDRAVEKLGGVLPSTAVIIPLGVRGRVMALVVAHSGTRTGWFNKAPDLLALSQAGEHALSELLLNRARKKAAGSAQAAAGTNGPQKASGKKGGRTKRR